MCFRGKAEMALYDLSYFQPSLFLPRSNQTADYSSSPFFKNTAELPPTTSPEEHLQGEVTQLQEEDDDTSTCHLCTGVTGNPALCPNIAYMYQLLMSNFGSYSDNTTHKRRCYVRFFPNRTHKQPAYCSFKCQLTSTHFRA